MIKPTHSHQLRCKGIRKCSLPSVLLCSVLNRRASQQRDPGAWLVPVRSYCMPVRYSVGVFWKVTSWWVVAASAAVPPLSIVVDLRQDAQSGALESSCPPHHIARCDQQEHIWVLLALKGILDPLNILLGESHFLHVSHIWAGV